MGRISFACLTLLLFLTAHADSPGDATKGKSLHDVNCSKCHGTDVYTRKDRRMKSLAALREQLGACSHAAQVILTDDEQRDIVKYLNQEFYKFK